MSPAQSVEVKSAPCKCAGCCIWSCGGFFYYISVAVEKCGLASVVFFRLDTSPIASSFSSALARAGELYIHKMIVMPLKTILFLTLYFNA